MDVKSVKKKKECKSSTAKLDMHQNAFDVNPLTKKKKRHQNKLSSAELDKSFSKENVSPIELVNDHSVKEKKKHKKKLFSKNIGNGLAMHFLPIEPVQKKRKQNDNCFCSEKGEDASMGLVNSHERHIGDQPVKSKKKHKNKKLNMGNVLHNLSIEHLDDRSLPKKKRKKNKPSLKFNEENVVQQDLHFINEKSEKEEKKRHIKKATSMKLQNGGVMLHDSSTVEVVGGNFVKRKKSHKIKLRSSAAEDKIFVIQSNSQTPVVDMPFKEKKKKRKNQGPATGYDDPILKYYLDCDPVNDHFKSVSDQLVKEKKIKHENKSPIMEYNAKGLEGQCDSVTELVDVDCYPIKKKKGHGNKKSLTESYKNRMQLDSKVEPFDDLPHTEQMKTKTLSLELDKDLNMQHESLIKPIEEPLFQKQKKKYETIILSTELHKDLVVRLDSEVETVDELQFKKQEKMHKSVILSRKVDKYIDKLFNLEVEPVHNPPLKKHKTTKLVSDLKENVSMHFKLENELVDNPSFKKQKKRHKSKTLSTELDKNLNLQDSLIKFIEEPPLKKHKTEIPFTELDKNLVMQFDSEVKTKDEPSFKTQKKRHKTKTLSTESDKDLALQFDMTVEPPLKTGKKKHKTKMYKKLYNELFMHYKPEVEPVDDVAFDKHKKRYKTKKLSTKSDNVLAMLLDSKVEAEDNHAKKQKSHKTKTSTGCNKDIDLKLDSEIKPVDALPVNKKKKKKSKTLSSKFEKNLVKHNSLSEVATVNDTHLKKQKNKNQVKKLFTQLGEGHVEQPDLVIKSVCDSSLEKGLNIELIDDKSMKKKSNKTSFAEDELIDLHIVPDNPAFEKQKKIHKTLSAELDIALAMQLDSEVQLKDNPRKKQQSHKAKTSLTESNKDINIHLDSEIKLIDVFPVKKQKKRNKSKTLSTESEHNSLTEVTTVKKTFFKKQKNKKKIGKIFTQLQKGPVEQLDLIFEPEGHSSLKKDLNIESKDDKSTKKKETNKILLAFDKDDKLVDQNAGEKEKCDKNSSSTDLDSLAVQHYAHIQETPLTKYDETLVVPLVSIVDSNQLSMFGDHKVTNPIPVNNESKIIKVHPNLTEVNVDIFAKNQCTLIEPTNHCTVTERKEMHKQVFSSELDRPAMQHGKHAIDEFDSENSFKYEEIPVFKKFNKGKQCNQQQEYESEPVRIEMPCLKKAVFRQIQPKRKKLFNIDQWQSYDNDENNPTVFKHNLPRKIPINVINNSLNKSNDHTTQDDLVDKYLERIIKNNVKHNIDSKFSSTSCLLNQEQIKNNLKPFSVPDSDITKGVPTFKIPLLLLDSSEVVKHVNTEKNLEGFVVQQDLQVESNNPHKRYSSMEQNVNSFLVQDSSVKLVDDQSVESERHKSELSLEPNESVESQHDLHVESVVVVQLQKEKKKKSSSTLHDVNLPKVQNFAHAVESPSSKYLENLEIQQDSHLVRETGQLLKYNEIEHCHQSYLFRDNEGHTLHSGIDTMPVNTLLEEMKKPCELIELAVDINIVNQHDTLVKPIEDLSVKEKREIYKAFPHIEPNDGLDMQHMCLENANDDKENDVTFPKSFDKQKSVNRQQENIAEYVTATELSCNKTILPKTKSLSNKLFDSDKQQIGNNDEGKSNVVKHRYILRSALRNIK